MVERQPRRMLEGVKISLSSALTPPNRSSLPRRKTRAPLALEGLSEVRPDLVLKKWVDGSGGQRGKTSRTGKRSEPAPLFGCKERGGARGREGGPVGQGL